jgi:hypothetical protein
MKSLPVIFYDPSIGYQSHIEHFHINFKVNLVRIREIKFFIVPLQQFVDLTRLKSLK